MPKYNKQTQRRKAQKFAKLVVQDDLTNPKAYAETFPDSNKTSCLSHGSEYAQKDIVQYYINKEIQSIEAHQVKAIIGGVVKDAKRSTKQILDKDGNKVLLKDNTSTIASRDQFFRLSGHPSFVSKGANIHIDNRSISLSNETAEQLIQAIDRIDTIDLSDCNQTGKEEDIIDV